MHYAWPTVSLPKLLGNTTHIAIVDAEGSWMAVLMLLGCPVGSIITLLTVDLFGRKKIMLLTAFPIIAAWIMIAYADIVEILYIARFVAGIADGIVYTVIPIYVCEIADPKIRGLLGSSLSITSMMGILLVNILGILFNIQISALISLFVPILFLSTFSWMPESPYYLIMTKREESARSNLMKLKGKVDVETDIERISKAIVHNNIPKRNMFDLFRTRSNRKSIIIVIGLRTFQQLSGYTAITFYAQIIFENISDFLPSNIITLIYFVIQCTVTMASSILLDRAGRKPLILISLIGCSISLIMQGTYYYIDHHNDLSHLNIIPILSLILFIVSYCMGLGTIPVLMLGELFPTNVKAFALCLTEIYYGIIATAASKFFQIVKDDFALFIPFYVFAACCLLGIIFVIRFVPETKGKTLEEIQEHLRGEKTEERNVYT